MIKKVFYKQRIFHDQGSFTWLGKFPHEKNIFIIREVCQNQASFSQEIVSTRKKFTAIQYLHPSQKCFSPLISGSNKRPFVLT